VHPLDLDRLKKFLSSKALSDVVEYRIYPSKQSVRWIRTTRAPVLDPAGEVVQFCFFSEDITDRRKAENLAHAQQFALEASTAGILITDSAGMILWANSACERMTGYSAGELRGNNPRILKSGKEDPCFYKAMWAEILSGEIWQGELIDRRKDGTLYPEEMRITPCQNSAGEITHFIALKQDLTFRKKAEEQHLRSQRMEMLGALASGIAHDLNNMLTPVMMAVSLLRETDPSQEHARLLQIMEDSARHGCELVKQVLTFARGISNEKMVLQPLHILKEFRLLVENTFPKSIDFRIQVPAACRTIRADPTQLSQVLMNLCVNARDAMPQGGRLLLGLHEAKLDRNYCSMLPQARPGDYIVLSVADTGSGIPPGLRERIFEPFFTTKEGKGSGLGLTTTQAIVKAHGGFIVVSGEPGAGSRFEVFLPVFSSEAHVRPADTLPPELQGGSELVLVVDDEEPIRNVCQQTLEHHGYRVLPARHGAEAVAIVAQRANEISVVITDMMMPVMDGSATIIALRDIQPDLRIICMSGLESACKESTGSGSEMTSFLAKPFSAEALLKGIRDVLAGSRRHPESAGRLR
jgi:PAS domain S-box-containing protein